MLGTSWAADQPMNLRYDFKVGDEFVVKVCNYGISIDSKGTLYSMTGNSGTSVECYYIFRPLVKYPDSVKMAIEVSRMVGWNYDYCFDTHAGFSPLNEWDRQLTNHKGIKI